MEQASGGGLNPKSVGWAVAVTGFLASFVVRKLMYAPWMVAIHLTGETTGIPGPATFLIALLLLALQWAAIGYFAALVCARTWKGARAGDAAPARPAPRVLSCCTKAAWVAERDLGSARGFDLTLGKCGACGTPWINAFCVAASTGGYEPVKPGDAEAMRTINDPAELKQFMRGWVEYLA